MSQPTIPNFGARRRLTIAAAVGALVLPSALFLGSTVAGAADDDPTDAAVTTEVSTVDAERRDLSVDHQAT